MERGIQLVATVGQGRSRCYQTASFSISLSRPLVRRREDDPGATGSSQGPSQPYQLSARALTSRRGGRFPFLLLVDALACFLI